MQLSAKHEEYWSKNLRITGSLLAIWFVVTFFVALFCQGTEFQVLWLAVFVLAVRAGRPGDLLRDHLVLRPAHEQA